MKSIEIKVIEFGSDKYKSSIVLRYDVLRKPLNMEYTSQQLEDEKNEIHIVAIMEDAVVGVLLLKIMNNTTLKMRQVAVDVVHQQKGIGTALVKFAEQYAFQHNFKIIELHARDTAIDFYLKNSYEIIGDEFLEVNIPHYKMIKEL